MNSHAIIPKKALTTSLIKAIISAIVIISSFKIYSWNSNKNNKESLVSSDIIVFVEGESAVDVNFDAKSLELKINANKDDKVAIFRSGYQQVEASDEWRQISNEGKGITDEKLKYLEKEGYTDIISCKNSDPVDFEKALTFVNQESGWLLEDAREDAWVATGPTICSFPKDSLAKKEGPITTVNVPSITLMVSKFHQNQCISATGDSSKCTIPDVSAGFEENFPTATTQEHSFVYEDIEIANDDQNWLFIVGIIIGSATSWIMELADSILCLVFNSRSRRNGAS